MATLADPTWVDYWISQGDVHTLDPRPPSDYARGHLPGAVNLPIDRLLGENGLLLPDPQLARAFGRAGLDESKRVLVYDGGDGGRGALMSWVLEYLGRGDVALCALLYEAWAAQGFPTSLEPATLPPGPFRVRYDFSRRATADDLAAATPAPKLLDLRSPEELSSDADRIPGAQNLPWTELRGEGGYILRSDDDLARRLKGLGVNRKDRVVAFGNRPDRACLGYQAIKRGGYNVSVLDGWPSCWRRG